MAITVDVKGAVKALLDAPEWLILVHEKPDGDAAGSGAALYGAGIKLGKKVTWGGKDPFPSLYSFIKCGAEYQTFREIPRTVTDDVLVVCLDTSNVERSVPGVVSEGKKISVLNIDHHVDNSRYGTMNLVDSSAAATAELVWALITEMGITMGSEEVLALYTGIVTDTGRFAFKATTAGTHRIVASLLEMGLDPQEADGKIFHNRTLKAFHLWGRAFSRVEGFAGGRAVLSWLCGRDFLETGATPEETEGLVNELLTLHQVGFAALITESESQVRVSLRSNGNVSAGQMARSFGGGGHEQAAGFRYDGVLEDVLALVRHEIEQRYDEFVCPD
jgi:phosphoesterase RecJ-like protein